MADKTPVQLYKLGNQYSEGKGVLAMTKSLEYYQAATDKGYPSRICTGLHVHRDGVPPHHDNAASWFDVQRIKETLMRNIA